LGFGIFVDGLINRDLEQAVIGAQTLALGGGAAGYFFKNYKDRLFRIIQMQNELGAFKNKNHK
jgi:hypothetical protein